MSLNLQIINPMTYPAWDELLLSCREYSFFHSSHWARVLTESYNFNPLYFVIMKRGALSGLIPLMEIKSFLTGQRGVSLPFSDYCDPIIPGDINFQDMFDSIVERGGKAGWKYIEVRGAADWYKELPVSSSYCGHSLDLSREEKEVFANFRSSTRRNIKKALKEGVEIRVSTSKESIKEFYRLNCITRKKHGLPPQPYYFFNKIFKHIISMNHGIVVLADYNGNTIAGAVYFHFGKKALYKYGASDNKYQHFRANNLVMWEAIQWYLKNRYTSLCFGRTDLESKGLMQFKAGWGTEEKIIKYHKYDFKKRAFLKGGNHVSELHNKIFNKMPIPMLKIIGFVLYKHMG